MQPSVEVLLGCPPAGHLLAEPDRPRPPGAHAADQCARAPGQDPAHHRRAEAEGVREPAVLAIIGRDEAPGFDRNGDDDRVPDPGLRRAEHRAGRDDETLRAGGDPERAEPGNDAGAHDARHGRGGGAGGPVLHHEPGARAEARDRLAAAERVRGRLRALAPRGSGQSAAADPGAAGEERALQPALRHLDAADHEGRDRARGDQHAGADGDVRVPVERRDGADRAGLHEPGTGNREGGCDPRLQAGQVHEGLHQALPGERGQGGEERHAAPERGEGAQARGAGPRDDVGAVKFSHCHSKKIFECLLFNLCFLKILINRYENIQKHVNISQHVNKIIINNNISIH